MGYADSYLARLEGKRKDALAAVAAYGAMLKDGKRLLSADTDIREKIDILVPPINSFERILGISKVN